MASVEARPTPVLIRLPSTSTVCGATGAGEGAPQDFAHASCAVLIFDLISFDP